MGEKHAYVMMIQDRWWSEFCTNNQTGRKVHSYVQKGLAPPKKASLILFYVAKPVGELAGRANFIERKAGEPESLWLAHGEESVLCSKEKFKEFIGNVSTVSFIRFRNLHEARHPVPLNDLLLTLGVKRLARRGFYVDRTVTDNLIKMME